MKVHRVVFMRHGNSIWNHTNRFQGWADTSISQQGIQESRAAGKRLKDAGFTFNQGYTSMLKRAIMSYNCIVDEMDLDWIPCQKHWRLNERHYGQLQGLDKQQTAKQFGDAQVLQWRRSYDLQPPPVDWNDEMHPRFDRKYRMLPASILPAGESLKQTINRVIPFW